MILGEVIQLPVTLQKLTNERSGRFKYNDVEIGFVRSLELYKVQFFFFFCLDLFRYCFTSNYLNCIIMRLAGSSYYCDK